MSSFVYNVVDKDGVSVGAKFQLYHYNTGNISDVRDTNGENQVSIDNEDADVDGIGVPFSSGNVALLIVWTGANTRDELLNEFAVIRIVSNDSNLYTGDIQLKPSQIPNVNLNVSVAGAIINEPTYTSVSYSNDEFEWIYNGITHYHKKTYYQLTVFNKVGVETIEYDFGSGYNTANNYTYTSAGDKTVYIKGTNFYGQEYINSKILSVKYHMPSISYSQSPTTVHLYDDVNISYTITDEDNQVLSVEPYFNNELMSLDSYDYTLDENKTYNYYTDVTWFDGYNDITTRFNGSVVLTNKAPTINLTMSNIDNLYAFNSNAADHENTISDIEFKLYVDSNAILEEVPTESNWSLLDTRSGTDLSTNITFYKGGKFKTTCIAYDGSLYSELQEVIFDVVVASEPTDEQKFYYEWN